MAQGATRHARLHKPMRNGNPVQRRLYPASTAAGTRCDCLPPPTWASAGLPGSWRPRNAASLGVASSTSRSEALRCSAKPAASPGGLAQGKHAKPRGQRVARASLASGLVAQQNSHAAHHDTHLAAPLQPRTALPALGPAG